MLACVCVCIRICMLVCVHVHVYTQHCGAMHSLLTIGAHAHEGLFVCYQSIACIRYLCNKMNVPANFSPNSKDFQLRDFAKKLSLMSYSLFFVFSTAKSAFFQFPVP